MSEKKKYLFYDGAILLMVLGVAVSGVAWERSTRIVIPEPQSTITMPRVEVIPQEPTEQEILDIINSERQDPVVEGDQYIQYFMQDVPAYRYRNAREYAPYVVAYAEQYDLDPLVLAVTISVESSWLPDVVGQLGERGLTQVHGVAAKGYNLAEAEEQIAAGAAWLSKCIDKCDGDLLGGLSMYQAGTSCKPHRGSRKRYNLYMDACREIRGFE